MNIFSSNKKLIFKIFALVLAVFSFCTLNMLGAKKHAFADQTSDEFTVITSLEEITDMSGKYRLENKDNAYTYTSSLGNFSGVLDGNGAIISYNNSVEFVATQPLFESLTHGAVVYNLCFAPTEDDVQNVYHNMSV